jgi:hypothetical protein
MKQFGGIVWSAMTATAAAYAGCRDYAGITFSRDSGQAMTACNMAAFNEQEKVG